jgi:MFS family permease
MSEYQETELPPRSVERAIRLSYAQAMLGAIYAASTGGMFLIGYALKLGATNAQIGLMSTIPMLCVVVQLFSSMLVERGISRRKMTIVGSLLNVFGWVLVIMLPFVLARASAELKVTALIAVIALITTFAYVAGNARSSWVGDLIPAHSRGMFFGRMTMYAGIIGAVFAVVEGRLLDHLKHLGISAFNWLFLFGIVFGLISTVLFFPQSDVRTERHESSRNLYAMIGETLTNRPLMVLMIYTLIWSMQSIAAPFYATYLLRDLKMSFLGFGILGGLATVTMLVSSPFWGRIVDRYGSKPVLIACTAVAVPVPLVWIWLTDLRTVYAVIPAINLMMGFVSAGISVALSTLIYKVTPSAGRSVQFAVYSVMILLLVSPMPAIGGHLPDWLALVGVHADLRCTFYASVIFLIGAALAARKILEPDSAAASEMVRSIPDHILNPSTLEPAED